MKHVKKLRKKLYSLKKSEGVEFVHGCGKRKTALQRSIETLEEYLSKLKEYTKRYTLAVAVIVIQKVMLMLHL